MSSNLVQTYPSECIFQIGTPAPSAASARFVYRYYEPGEGTDENLNWVERYYSGSPKKIRNFYVKGSPRYVDITFDLPASELGTGQSQELQEHVQDLMEELEEDNESLIIGVDIFSEYDIQKNGFVGIDFNPSYQTNVVLSKAVSPEESIFGAFLNTASNTAGEDLSLTDVAGIDKSTSIPEIEPSTNQKIERVSGRIPDMSMPALVNDDFMYDIFAASNLNTCLAYESQISPQLSSVLTKQKSARASNTVSKIDLADTRIFEEFVPFSQIMPDSPTETLQRGELIKNGDFAIVGHIIMKYRQNFDGSEEFIEGYLVKDQTFRDYRVAYGKTYKYVIHSVVAFVLDSHNTVEDKVYLFYSGENNRLTVPCVENVAPKPPSALNFSYYRGALRISWREAHQITEGSDGIGRLTRISVDDIKGYQIFCRKSLNEPYELKKYYHFHNGDYPQYALENIPATLKEKTSGEVLQHLMAIESNQEYYFAMCSIDAHGNSSPYSEQIYVYHDKISGKLTTKLVSESGAPKAYPNMYYKASIFKDSISSSQHNKVEIVYHPDISSIAEVSNGSSPVYAMQLIDISSMTDQVINLIVKETSDT